MKKVILILFVIIIVCIFLNQWNQFTAEKEKVNAEESAQMKVSIDSDNQSLYINQTISLLADESIYKIKIPEQAQNWTCTYNNEDECMRVWGAKDIVESKGNQLHFTYTIPINKDNITIMNDWLFQLSGVTNRHVDLDIIESHQREGSWIAGIPLSGFVKEDLIDYYTFSGISNNPSLLWYPENISSEQNSVNYAIYGDYRKELKELIQNHNEIVTDVNFLSIITTNQLKGGLFGGILILPKGESMEREFIKSVYFHSIKMEEDKEWFLDLLTSFIIEESPKFVLGKHAYNELTEKLSAKELERLVAVLTHVDESFVPEEMDEVIYQITGKQTNFFTELLKSNQAITLEMFALKDYHWNEKKLTVKVIEVDGVEWVPLQKTMSFLEFETERLTETEWAVFKEKDVFRLYSDQSIFIRNEEVYGLLEHPLMKMNGEYYLEKKWLKSIFNLELVEEDNQVHFFM